MTAMSLLGDLRERPDGSFDGWCWAPDRPQERMIVDLLVDNALAISMVAAIFRRDLQTSGYGDGRHGFVLRLPPGTQGLDRDALITARERRSGAVFGRLLRSPAVAAPPHGAVLDRLELDLQQARAALGAAAAGARPGTLARWRAVCAQVSARLMQRVAMAPPPVLAVPVLDTPALTLAFLAEDAAATFAAIESLAPALALVRAELVVIDPGTDPRAAGLPGRVRPLRFWRGPAGYGPAGYGPAGYGPLGHGHPHAAAQALRLARGAQFLWFGAVAAPPSAAALMSLAHALAQTGPAVWLGCHAGQTSGAGVRGRHALPSRLGLRVAMDRGLGEALGDLDTALDGGGGLAGTDLAGADLACRAELLGIAVHEVVEPAAAGHP